ncbi:MAG: hypothetical protein QOF48_1527 [Verrucomicrobiota bacterium]
MCADATKSRRRVKYGFERRIRPACPANERSRSDVVSIACQGRFFTGRLTTRDTAYCQAEQRSENHLLPIEFAGGPTLVCQEGRGRPVAALHFSMRKKIVRRTGIASQRRWLAKMRSVRKSALAKRMGFASVSGRLAASAVSSVVEHFLDTEGVTGSNPVSRTILQCS